MWLHGATILAMKAVGIRELKNHLSEYVRLVRDGEEIQVTYRGEVVAELRRPESPREDGLHPGLRELFRRGTARQVARNDPTLYPRFAPALSRTTAQELLDQERGDR